MAGADPDRMERDPLRPGHEPDQDPRRDDENLPPTHQPYGRPPAPQNPYGAPSTPPPASNPYGSGEDQPQQPPYGQHPYGQGPYGQGSSTSSGYGQPGRRTARARPGAVRVRRAVRLRRAPPPANHPSATTALVLSLIGLAGIVFCGGITLVLSPFAWRIGASAVREIDASQGASAGGTRPTPARIMGIIGTVLLALGILRVLGLVGLLAAGSTGESASAPAPAERRLSSAQPTSTGSLTSRMPNRASTPSRTSRARASRSAVLAPPRLVSASVCLVERPTGPVPWPLPNPACSISQAALVFTVPSGCGQAGAPVGQRAPGRRTGW